MSEQQPKQLTRNQMTMAIEAVEQVKEFIKDSGLDASGEQDASLTTAISSLELVRKHWTPPTRVNRPTRANKPVHE